MTDQFFPADDPIVDPDADLAASDDINALDLDESDDVIVAQEPLPPIGRSWAFDFSEDSFFTGGGHGPLRTYDDETLRGWIEKTLHTAKGAHPVYPSDYGMTSPFGTIGHALTSADLGGLEADIRDALTFHPRIDEVTDFAFDKQEDDEALFVTFTYVRDDGTGVRVTVS
jgi:hypothetical protein